MIIFICEKAIIISVIAVFAAIFVDFTKYGSKNAVKRSRRSIVATGSMIGFYAVYYLALRFRLGCFGKAGNIIYMDVPFVLAGTAMIVTGAIINILGRLQLKGNWANHIKIYEDHSFVHRGVYKIVRHPLYASIMLMMFGGGLAYRNWLSAALTALVFIPFMHYRAKQEETLLIEEFAEYAEYKKNTGMFFPKLWRR